MKWLRDKVGQATISKALANAQEEAFYEQAALEVAKGDIRPGLWAKAIAVADGDEHKAHARYLGFRVEQMQLQSSAAEEVARMHLPEDGGHSGIKKAYDAVNGKCPNSSCNAIIPLQSQECPKCKALFVGEDGWKVLPIATN